MDDYLVWLFASFYIMCYSYGYYIQVFLMMKTRSAEGLSINSQILNIVSILCYLFYSLFRVTHIDKNIVSILDMISAIHISFISSFVLVLTLYYPRCKNKYEYSTGFIIAIVASMCCLCYWISQNGYAVSVKDLALFVGLNEVIIDGMQNIYQVFLNADKQSTKGFAIDIIIGEAMASFFVIIEVSIESQTTEMKELNIPKLALAIIILSTDAIILYQHYYCYRKDRMLINKQPELRQ